MEEETTNGLSIKELKTFLNNLPEKFDKFNVVNGEIAYLGDEHYVRIDKPIVHLEIDESSGELLILHQTEEEITEIKNKLNGNTEGD